jgi:peptidoglycan/LPS O-acetylase OafA/YrhL
MLLNFEIARNKPRNHIWSYWPEIDGLRSIAVLSVFVFHFDRQLLSGGFVGVDIFFAISGFLITTILLNDFDQGHFSITRFYQRRIARLAPAFFTVLFATLVVGSIIYSAQDFSSLGANSVAASLSAINVKLLYQGNYFQISTDAQPILHYWSLSVEEQFYLVFPLYLFFLLKFSGRPLAITLAVCLLSFGACAAVTKMEPVFAFYLLPTRAWELLAGSALALFRRDYRTIPAELASITSWLGFGLLALSFLTINEGNNFPGWIAAIPVFGTVLILASIETAKGSSIQTLLAHPLLVFVGKRSYSLYLWHWSIFSFVDYHFFSSGSTFRATLKILICIATTLLTYHFVERPMRTYLNGRRSGSVVFGGFAITVLAVCFGGIEIRSRNYLSADPQEIAAGGIALKTRGKGTVALIGDSQGAMYGHELASLARAIGFDLNVLSGAATNELPNEPGTHWAEVKQYLLEHRPNVVILAEAWSSKLGSDTRNLREALSSLEPFMGFAILITQPPILPADATREAIRLGARPPFFEKVIDRESRLRSSMAIHSLASKQVSILEATESLLGTGGEIRVLADNGRLTYQDATHLSDSGTAFVRPALERALIEALRER